MSEQATASNAAGTGWRWYVSLSRWLWWLAISFWAVMLLATVALHWLIVPRIIDWQPEIEAMASRAWGVKVSIGRLQAESDGWVPSFVLSDFVLRDQQDQEVMRLPVVRVSLSPASLFSLTLDQIELQGPELEVRRDAQGRWQVAGMWLGDGDNTAIMDWLLRQPDISIRHGRLRWVDDLLQQPEVDLTAVSMQLRNGLRSHSWRLDAQPPAGWGQTISIQGQFSQALLNSNASDIASWKGRFYAQLPQIDISRMSVYLKHASSAELLSGRGWLRAWVDIDQGVWNNQTLDLGLQDVRVKLDSRLDDIHLQQVAGRLHMQSWLGGLGQEVRTEQLQVTPAGGAPWSSGKTRFAWRHAASPQEPFAATGELHIDDMPLEVMARVAARMPMDEGLRAHLNQAKPAGQVHALDLQWFDAGSPAMHYKAAGRLHGLRMESSAPQKTRPSANWWWPGVQDAQVDFEFNEQAGSAQLNIQDGSVTLVDWLEEPLVPVKKFQSKLTWGKTGQTWQLQMHDAQASTADGQASFDLHWREGEQPSSFGHLDLQLQVQRLQASRLHRYLPQAMDVQARRYLRDALTYGWFDKAVLNLKGPLDHFPFSKTNDGVFTLQAPFQQVNMQYAPAAPGNTAGRRDPLSWPQLQQANGELQINQSHLQLKSASARLGTQGQVQVGRLEVLINDLNDIAVDVNAQFKGNLSDAMQVMLNTPLRDKLAPWMNPGLVNGLSEHELHLHLPLANTAALKLQGALTLPGNDIQLQAGLPRMGKVKGVINYTQSGLSTNNLRLRVFGGDARLDGGLRFSDSVTEGPARLSLQGSISAEALRQSTELPSLTGLATRMEGNASYAASLGLRQGVPEITVISNLQGMALDFPAPLRKPTEASWPMRFDSVLLPPATGKGSAMLEQVQLKLAQVLSVSYVRDVSTATPTVVRGQIQIGQSAGWKDAPDNTVVLQVKQPNLNADEWQTLLASFTEEDSGLRVANAGRSGWSAYVPNKIDISSQELVWSGRTYNQLQVNADKQARVWRIQARANEFQGSAEYRPAADGSAARVSAHLNYLTIPPAVLEDVESAMSESPKDMPALDLIIDNLELRGVALGKAEIEGFARTSTNGSREWVLGKLNLTMPEASLQSKGQWGGPGKGAAKRSQLEFVLQIQDSGQLLDRLGFKGAIKNGKGRMVGQVGWQGSPFSPDYKTMTGQFNVNMERGQFLKSDPGVARLLGVLSLQSLPRRLMLDFSDLFSEGFMFDFVRGDVQIQQGIASTNNLQMKGVSAAVLMEGKADIKNETQDIKVVIVPELNAGTASLVYSAINPLVGLSTFLAQFVLRKPLMKSSTQELHVQGTWKDPKVSKVDSSDAKPSAAKP